MVTQRLDWEMVGLGLRRQCGRDALRLHLKRRRRLIALHRDEFEDEKEEKSKKRAPITAERAEAVAQLTVIQHTLGQISQRAQLIII